MSGQLPDHHRTVAGPTAPSAVRSGLDAVLLVSVAVDGTLHAEAANEAARALLGVAAGDDLLGDDAPPRVAPLVARLRLAATRQRATREPFVLRSSEGDRLPLEVQLEPMPAEDGATRVMAVLRAVSEIDLGEEERSGSQPAVGVFRIERSIGFVFVDEALLTLLGLSHEQAFGQGWLDAVHGEDRTMVEDALARVDDREEGLDLECRILRDGIDERLVRVRAVPVRGDAGAVTGYLGSMEDLTEQRRSERAGTRLAELADAAQEMIGVSDSNWRIVYANPAARLQLALPEDDPLVEYRTTDFLPAELKDELATAIGDALAEAGRWSGEAVLCALDGRKIDVECTIIQHSMPTGEVDHYSFLGRDVTALHDMERALRESEERFRLMAESSAIGIFMLSRTGAVEYANPRLAEILGRPVDEVLGSVVFNSLHPDDRPAVYAESNAAARERRESSQDFRIVRPDGDVRWLRTNAAPVLDDAGTIRGFVGSIEDTTDERLAEQERLLLQRTVESTSDHITFHDLEGRMFFANAAARRFLGLEADARVPPIGPSDFLDVTDAELEQIGAALTTEGRWAGELDVMSPDGARMPAWAVVVAHNDARGKVEYYSAVTRDVSDRRRVESRLAAGAAWFRSLVQHTPDLLAVLNADGTVKYVSPSSERLTGHTPRELIGGRLGALSDAEVRDFAQKMLESPGVPIHVEGNLRHRDGSSRAFEGSVTNLLDDPAVRGLVVNARDVTDRREAEAARRRSETALRAIVQASPLAIFALDRKGTVHVWNAACEHMFGWAADEVVGGPPPFFSDDVELENLLAKAFSGETITGYDGRVARVDGAVVDIDVAIAPLRDGKGRVVTAVAVVADVTEQKRAQQELRASEVRFRSLVQHSSDMLTVLDENGVVIFMSPSACEFLGCDQDEMVGQPPPAVLHPDDTHAAAEMFTKLRAAPGRTEIVTLRIERRSAGYRWIELIATNLLDEPAVRGIVTNSRDITERFEAEAAIRDSEERLRALVASVSDMISVIDAHGRLQYTSPVSERLLGYPEGAGYGEDIFDLVHPEDRHGVAEMFATARELSGTLRPIEVRLQRADGSWMDAEVIANNLLDEASVQGIVMTTRDITERKAAEEALRGSERRLREGEAHYRAVVDDQTELVCRYLPDTTLTFVNRAFAEFYDRDAGELLGSRLIDLFPTTDRTAELTRLRAFGRGQEVQTQEDWELAADGSVHWYQWTDRAFLDDDGVVIEFQSVGRDVTDRRRAAVLTAHQAEILEQIARGLPLDESLATIARTVEDHFPKLVCAISLLEPDGTTLRVGAAPTLPTGMRNAMDTLRIGPVSCSGGTAAYRREPVHVSDIAADPLWVNRRDVALAHGFHAAWSYPILASDGHAVLGTLDVYSRTVRAPDAENHQIISLLAHLASIGIERKAFEERLAYQSMHDPLTGLPNRLLFLDRLSLSVARCRRTHTQVGVLFLDLDRFKNVNDSVGHDAGDELLIAVARRLEAALRPGDTVARFGGDEFTILCEDLPNASARERTIEIARRLLVAVAQPFIVRGSETFVSASLGIALASGEERPEELLRDADAAMYHAKEAGRGRVEVFDDTMRARALARHATENALHRALERGELLLFFQPVVSLRDARCVGAEALVRWQHPERGLIAPSEFVPLAEETGLVVELGAWVLEEAARQAAQWQLDCEQPFVVSVNLSARQLAQPDLAEQVGDVLARTGLASSNLCLEITESVLMDDAEAVISVIERVRALGVRLAIDDFGTGYSSLGYLKRFPVDLVKIDRSFVDGLGSDPGDTAIVSAVIGLAHALNLQVVAEGVESEEQLAELVALGCDDAQGYFFAPPQPVDDLRALIGRTRAWRPPGIRIIGGDAPPAARRTRH